MRRFPALPALVFVLALSALVGGFFGRNALATDDKVFEYNKAFSAALGAVESSYVDKVDSDRLVYGAIRGMLATLVPFQFYDPKEYSRMRERQEGRYYGLGITIQANNGDILRPRSEDLRRPRRHQARRRHREDWDRRGKGWTTEQRCRSRSEGKVVPSISNAADTPTRFRSRSRATVQILTVPAYFMIDATTGCIRHQDWARTRTVKSRRPRARPRG
jgi:carboxyl-terminal processing protease